MKGKLLLLAGAAVGYVFGTRAGRERYEEIKQRASQAWHDPRVQEKVTEAEHFLNDTAKQKLPEMQERLGGAVDKAKSKLGNGKEQGEDALASTGTSTTGASTAGSTTSGSTSKSAPTSTPSSPTTGPR